MHRLSSDIAAIEELNSQIASFVKEGDYEALSTMVPKRLTMLKALDEKVRQLDYTDEEANAFNALLTRVEQDNAIQLPIINQARKDVVASRVNIDKGRTAVNLYNNISKN